MLLPLRTSSNVVGSTRMLDFDAAESGLRDVTALAETAATADGELLET